MDEGLKPVYERIFEAVSAEELFGVTDIVLPTDSMLDYLRIEFEKLEEVVNPSNWSDVLDVEAARDAMDKLCRFYEAAQKKIEEGTFGLGNLEGYNKSSMPSFETSKRKYFIGDALIEGGTSIIYEGLCEVGEGDAGKVVIKLAKDPSMNSYLANEIRILRELHSVSAPQWKHLPFLLDEFKSGGRQGLVLRMFNGYDLLEVRENPRYVRGIHRKDMIWMMNRALSALAFSHALGIIHANLKPGHIMIRPKDHNLCILDWGSAVFQPAKTGEKYRTVTPIYSPKEVVEGLTPLPSTDVYSLGKIMIWLLGGNPETNEIPDNVEPQLERFLRGLVIESPLQRPEKVKEITAQREAIVTQLWGPKKFRIFVMD